MASEKKGVRSSGRSARVRRPAFVDNERGVRNWKEARGWLEWRGIEDIECITPDQGRTTRPPR
jgi:glutamine synthetase